MNKEITDKLLPLFPALETQGQKIVVNIYRLLAEGEPVSVQMVAEKSEVNTETVEETLKDLPGIFRDDDGSIIGFWGLAIREMPHQFKVEGQDLYTWCAWDSLFIPEILGKTAEVKSKCLQTGETVHLKVTPDGIESPSHSDLVVSFLVPEALDENIVQSFCHHVHFFASKEAFEQWTKTHPDAIALSLAQAFEIGKKKNQHQFGLVL